MSGIRDRVVHCSMQASGGPPPLTCHDVLLADVVVQRRWDTVGGRGNVDVMTVGRWCLCISMLQQHCTRLRGDQTIEKGDEYRRKLRFNRFAIIKRR